MASTMLSTVRAAPAIGTSIEKRVAYAACFGVTADRSRRRLTVPTIRKNPTRQDNEARMKNGESCLRPGR